MVSVGDREPGGPDGVEKVDLEERRYDFILCSHVLCCVNEGGWLSLVENMHELLESGGALAVVLQSPLGEVARFFNSFTSCEVSVLDLWRNLVTRYGEESLDVRYFINEIWTETLDDMVDIGLFLLIDRRFRERTEDIARYFHEYHRARNGYRLRQDEILLTAKKAAPER